MLLKIIALLVWALAAASAVFWGMRAFSAGKPIPLNAAVAQIQSIPAGGSLGKVLGMTLQAATEDEPVEEDGRFKLLGVVAPRQTGERGGVALIAVGDQPAKPFRVGATIDGESVLLAVARRGAEIGPRGGPAAVQLALPDPDSAPRPNAPATPAPTTRGMPPSGMAQQPGLPPPQAHILPVRPPLQAPSAVPGQQPNPDEDE